MKTACNVNQKIAISTIDRNLFVKHPTKLEEHLFSVSTIYGHFRGNSDMHTHCLLKDCLNIVIINKTGIYKRGSN